MNPFAPTLTALLLLAAPLGAQITADLAISEGGSPLGTITLELDHVKAPVATANFIGLATGKFPWIDSSTGVVQSDKPYYNGIIFHRVIAGFMNQTGSQKGDGSDGPGYSFPDAPETSNGLTHASGHVVSMANSGPNTNGSQIFITVAPANHLNGKHIVFGEVAAGASRTLADTINARPVIDADGPDNIPGTSDDNNRPVTDITIDSITVHYNGVSFDPCAQGLPAVSSPDLASLPGPISTALDFTQPARSLAQVAHTTDLSSWNISDKRYLDENDSPLSSFGLPGSATGNPSQLLAPALISYGPTAIFPSSLANRTLTALTAIDSTYPFTFEFNASGMTGTWNYPNPTNTLSGNIANSLFIPDGYGGRLIMILSGINFDYWDFRRIGFDDSSPTELSGRHTGIAIKDRDTEDEAILSIDGTFTLTR